MGKEGIVSDWWVKGTMRSRTMRGVEKTPSVTLTCVEQGGPSVVSTKK